MEYGQAGEILSRPPGICRDDSRSLRSGYIPMERLSRGMGEEFDQIQLIKQGGSSDKIVLNE